MIAALSQLLKQVRHGTALPWLVLAIGVSASLLLFGVIRKSVDDVARLRFERQSSDAKGTIEDRISFYNDILYGLKALFASQGPVSRLQFHDFVESLDLKKRYPGFDLVNYAEYVAGKDKKAFEESVRKDTTLDSKGYPQFAIKPPGERSEYYVVSYLEPIQGFEFAFGLDLAASPQVSDTNIVAKAQAVARDSGKLTASGRPIRIRAPGKEYIGQAMRLAVYRRGRPLDTVEQRRAAYLGSVGAGINVENMLKDILDENIRGHMRFRVYASEPVRDRSGSASGEDRFLFDSRQVASAGPSVTEEESGPVFTTVLPIEVGNGSWEIHFSAPKNVMIEPLNRAFPFMVLVGGLLSSILLAGVSYSLSSSRSRAVKMADQITKDLRESEERFRLIAENAYDMIALLSPEGRLVYLNPAYGGLIENYKALVGTESFQSVHPEDRERVRGTFFDTVRDGVARRAEFRFLLPSGEARYMESQVSSVSDSQGNVVRVIKVSRDVTERRQKDEALRAHEVQLQEAQALANLGSWEWDVPTNSRRWSEQLSKIFGVARNQLPSAFDGFYPFVHPEDRERTARAARKALRSGDAYESQFRIVRPDGEVREIHSKARVDRDASGRPVRVLGICQDITERKRAEEQARVSQERFRTMVENVRDYAIYMLDTRGHVTSWNLGAERIAGYHAEEIIGRHYSLFFLPDHAARGDPGIQLEFAALQGRYESEGWRVRKDGSRFWAHVIATPLHDAGGKLRGFSEISHDITERMQAEAAIHQAGQRLQIALEGSQISVWETDLRTNEVWLDAAWATFLGNPAAEARTTAAELLTLVHPEDRKRVAAAAVQAMKGEMFRYAIDHRVKSANGEWRWILSCGRVIERDSTGRPLRMSGTNTDITDRKRAEEDLLNYADRLRVTSRRLVEIQESERRLIARELHDRVGQNLTGLGLNLSIVAGGLQSDANPELAARLEDCNALMRDTVDAIRSVMTELRPHTLDEYGLPAALRSLAAGFSRRTGIQVAFDGDSTRTDFPKTVDLAMFRIAQEALNNIAKHSSADRVEIAIGRRNGCATLSVQDNGVGFDQKRVGSTEGSGWGLLIMRERAEAVGAQFSLKAEPDAGVKVLVEYRAGAEV